MDLNFKRVKSDAKNNNLSNVESPKVGVIGESEEEDESLTLLPSKKGGLSKKSQKAGRKVQWLDKNGHKLAQILEFQPSDVSDSEEEDSDSCICIIM